VTTALVVSGNPNPAAGATGQAGATGPAGDQKQGAGGEDEAGGVGAGGASAGGGGGCTPGYSPCLAPASDYDCEGGTGDGPEYTGRAQVTGADPYDLDADGNGVGCE
jgi:hypothetical protein